MYQKFIMLLQTANSLNSSGNSFFFLKIKNHQKLLVILHLVVVTDVPFNYID